MLFLIIFLCMRQLGTKCSMTPNRADVVSQGSVPPDSSSELDPCTATEGAPPIVQRTADAAAPPSASSGSQAAAAAHSAEQAPSSGITLTEMSTGLVAEQQQPQTMSVEDAVALPVPAAESLVQQHPTRDDRSAADVAQVKEAEQAAAAADQPAAAAVTSLLTADPKDVAAIAAAAGHFLKAEHIAPAAAAPVDANGPPPSEPAAVAAAHQATKGTSQAAEAEDAEVVGGEAASDHQVEPPAESVAGGAPSVFLQAVTADVAAALAARDRKVPQQSAETSSRVSAAPIPNGEAAVAPPVVPAAEPAAAVMAPAAQLPVAEPEVAAGVASEAVPMEVDAAAPAPLAMTAEGALPCRVCRMTRSGT